MSLVLTALSASLNFWIISNCIFGSFCALGWEAVVPYLWRVYDEFEFTLWLWLKAAQQEPLWNSTMIIWYDDMIIWSIYSLVFQRPIGGWSVASGTVQLGDSTLMAGTHYPCSRSTDHGSCILSLTTALHRFDVGVGLLEMHGEQDVQQTEYSRVFAVSDATCYEISVTSWVDRQNNGQ